MNARPPTVFPSCATATLVAVLFSGCSTVDPTPDYDRAVQEIQSATGAANVYHPDIHDDIPNREAELLEQGLELQEAVELGFERARQTLRNIKGLKVIEEKARVEDGEIVEFLVTLQVIFLLDESDED